MFGVASAQSSADDPCKNSQTATVANRNMEMYLLTSVYQVPACVARRTLDMLFPIFAMFLQHQQCCENNVDCWPNPSSHNFLIPTATGSYDKYTLRMREDFSFRLHTRTWFTPYTYFVRFLFPYCYCQDWALVGTFWFLTWVSPSLMRLSILTY